MNDKIKEIQELARTLENAKLEYKAKQKIMDESAENRGEENH